MMEHAVFIIYIAYTELKDFFIVQGSVYTTKY